MFNYSNLRTMTLEDQYIKWHDSLGLKYISAREMLWTFKRQRDHVTNQIPPAHLWPRLAQPLFILDALRGYYGKPIRITSTYRSLQYNRQVGSSDGSQHPKCRAIDFQIIGVSPSSVARKLKSWRKAGLFKGGIGRYNEFVHIDTRGTNATWPSWFKNEKI